MGLKSIVTKGIEAIFFEFKEAVKLGDYTVETNDGWGNVDTSTDVVRVIIDKLKQEDVERTSFYDLIQPTDVVGLVPGADLSLAMKTSNVITIEERVFTIVAFDTDAFEALFTLLLRDT